MNQAELRNLIAAMSRANHLWGAPYSNFRYKRSEDSSNVNAHQSSPAVAFAREEFSVPAVYA